MAKFYEDNSHLIMDFTQSNPISRAVYCSYPKQKCCILCQLYTIKTESALQTHFDSVSAYLGFLTHDVLIEKIKML